MIEAISQQALSCSFTLAGQQFTLLPERCIYWHETHTLILSDLHLGKVGHFRKAGIPVPSKVHFDDLNRLSTVIGRLDVKRIIFIGDLFHSDINQEWNLFEDWLSLHEHIRFVLIKGNHDILPATIYQNSRMEIYTDCLSLSPFFFCHIPPEPDTDLGGLYSLSGHIHPGIRLQGPGRQVEKLPCFYFGEKNGILPAFGRFTGLHHIKPKEGDKIFAIAGTRVISL